MSTRKLVELDVEYLMVVQQYLLYLYEEYMWSNEELDEVLQLLGGAIDNAD